jgi:DNA polymerase-3 subunit delta
MPTSPATTLIHVPSFRAAYLIHGDDHGRISERRARLRAMAENAAGTAGVEVYEADACTPDAVAAALSAMTFAMGRRFVIADGVERWKEGDVDAVAGALTSADPESLTVAFFAREEARAKAPAKLRKAVEAVGGQIAEEATVKPWELPKWLVKQAAQLDLDLDSEAAKVLIAQVGDRQQRLLRELEKLALEHGAQARLGVEEVQEACASSAERRVWTLTDAMVAGDRRTATRVLLELRTQGERLPGMTYTIARKLREALAVAEGLAAGQSPAQVKKTLRMSPRQASKLVADVERRDADAFRRALTALADFELESRGGVGGRGGLGEETSALKAVLTATR